MWTDVIFIHLDDQMDSKMLLGNYVCTEIPGEFKWQPGALTQVLYTVEFIELHIRFLIEQKNQTYFGSSKSHNGTTCLPDFFRILLRHCLLSVFA